MEKLREKKKAEKQIKPVPMISIVLYYQWNIRSKDKSTTSPFTQN